MASDGGIRDIRLQQALAVWLPHVLMSAMTSRAIKDLLTTSPVSSEKEHNVEDMRKSTTWRNGASDHTVCRSTEFELACM